MAVSDNADSQSNARGSRVKKTMFVALAMVLVLAIIEGLSSFGLFAYDIIVHSSRPIPERQHTQYDKELGWINSPGAFVEDMYGPGRSVTINRQGFRSKTEYALEAPAGRTRILCSGDSFTLGYGVGDDDTWCAILERQDPRYEVVNMGQGGYGFDQVYLWYARDGHKLQHDIHLMCLGVHAILRMRYDQFAGYGKPTLKLEGNRIVADNVPIPHRSYYVPWLTQNLELLRSCRMIELGSRMTDIQWIRPLSLKVTSKETTQLTIRALQTMYHNDQRHGSHLIVVWLPTQDEFDDIWMDADRDLLLNFLKSHGVSILDLIKDLRSLTPDRANELFLKPEDVDFIGAEGHYSEKGNQFFAERIYEHLQELVPHIANSRTN